MRPWPDWTLKTAESGAVIIDTHLFDIRTVGQTGRAMAKRSGLARLVHVLMDDKGFSPTSL